MRMRIGNWLSRRAGVVGLVFGLVLGLGSFATAASGPHYLVTNDDVPPFFFSGVSVYTIGSGGLLKFDMQVQTGGSGAGGGYFGSNRIAVLNSGTNQCIYASNAFVGDIVGISVTTLTMGGSTSGSSTDAGTANGIGLVMNDQYLYASFTDSNTIGTFQVQPGCSLSFVNDVSVVGLQSGVIDGMAIHGNTMVATYGDGSIESFDISNGTPVSNGDKQNSSAAVSSGFATFPTSVKITKDGHYALFGDTSTSSTVEVSNLASGKLAKTVIYKLGTGISSSNILFSPDETLLYISNTQGDKLSAAFFDHSTGKLTFGCSSGSLRGYVSGWSYLASLATASETGTGGAVYAAEFGSTSAIATVNVTSANGQCTLAENAKSPVADGFSTSLLSIGTFPPPAF
jgi:hypothetical protein